MVVEAFNPHEGDKRAMNELDGDATLTKFPPSG
jgi:hypothetical protein